MLVDEHLARALSFEKSAAKLDPVEDAPLWIVFLMRAGTGRVNAVLHALGITEEGPVAAGARIGDMNHSYKPSLCVELPQEVHVLLRHLKFIEDLRPEYVRGSNGLTPELAGACRGAYEEIVAGTTAILERRREPA